MKQQFFALSFGFAGLILATQHGYAQTATQTPAQCGPRDKVVAHLAQKFGESRHSIGLAANNMVMEVFASTETGSWTITVTSGSGLTCLVASGQNYESLAEELPAVGKGA